MGSELRECPLCGGSAELRDAASGRQNWVECMTTDCHAMGPNRGTPRDAVLGWNRRSPSPESSPPGDAPKCARCSSEQGPFCTHVMCSNCTAIDPCRPWLGEPPTGEEPGSR